LPVELNEFRRAILVQHDGVFDRVEAAWVDETIRFGRMFVKGIRPQLSDTMVAGE
jgi:hypothetical protein